MTDGFNFTLSSPLTKEDWNKICDAELEHTQKIVYKTPSGKEVTFISLAELEKIKAETIIDELEKIKAEMLKKVWRDAQGQIVTRDGFNHGIITATDIIDKHISELKGENNE